MPFSVWAEFFKSTLIFAVLQRECQEFFHGKIDIIIVVIFRNGY